LSALRLDILDLNFCYSSEKIGALSLLPAFTLSRPGLHYRIASFLYHMVRAFRVPGPKSGCAPTRAILLFVTTKNQRDSLLPVVQCLNDGILAGDSVPVSVQFPVKWAYLMAAPYFPLVWLQFFRADQYARNSFYYYLNNYWLIYGYYIVARGWLQRLAPRAVVVANDHDYPNRVVSQAAHDLGIPTFYLQHASVDVTIPPLSYDFALLDGMDALQKYADAGPSATKVFLIGVPKADAFYSHINLRTAVRSVGLCANNLDWVEPVEQLAVAIRAALPDLPLTLRPHPGDRKRWPEWLALAEKCGMAFSDSQEEMSFEFLKRIDAVVVGDSNILLEAAMLDIHPLYYDFNQTKLDHYGFFKNGLVDRYVSPPELCRKLSDLMANKPSIRLKTKRYCHTVGTAYDGRSAELAAGLIQRLLNREVPAAMSEWRRIPDCRIEAYEPASP
jgi:hypothetical protein